MGTRPLGNLFVNLPGLGRIVPDCAGCVPGINPGASTFAALAVLKTSTYGRLRALFHRIKTGAKHCCARFDSS